MAKKNNKRFAKGANRVANTLESVAKKIQTNIDRATAWGLTSIVDSLQHSGESIMEAIDRLKQLVDEGWQPPRKTPSRASVEEGSMVQIIDSDRSTYAELYGVTKTEMDELKVVMIRESKRDAIVVKTKSGKQFPIPRRHISAVVEA